MEGQRSKVTDLLYLYNCQLGLGLVTLMENSRKRTLTLTLKEHAGRTVVMTVAARFNTDDYSAFFETSLGTEPV